MPKFFDIDEHLREPAISPIWPQHFAAACIPARYANGFLGDIGMLVITAQRGNRNESPMDLGSFLGSKRPIVNLIPENSGVADVRLRKQLGRKENGNETQIDCGLCGVGHIYRPAT
jgi:hypothetical protein